MTIGFLNHFRHLCLLLLVIASAEKSNSQSQAFHFYQRSLDKSLPFKETVQSAQQALLLVGEETPSEEKYATLANLIHAQLGILYWNNGQFKNALAHLGVSEALSRKRQDYFMLAKSLHYKGMVYYYRCDFDSALDLYGQAEKYYFDLKNDSAIAKLKSHKSLIFNVQGSYNLAIQNVMESFRLQESMPGYRDLSVSLEFPSSAATQLYYKSKLSKDFESSHYLEEKKDTTQLAFAYFNIGKDYHYLKMYREAIRYLRRSCTLYQHLGQLPFTGDLAAAYASSGAYDSAQYYYALRLNDVKTAGTQIHLAAVYSDIGTLFRKQQKWSEALHYFDLALDLNRQMGLLRSEARVGKTKAEVLFDLGRFSTAHDIINRSLFLSKSIGCLKDTEEFLRLKSKILAALHREAEALSALEQSQMLRDSVANGESRLQTVQLQIKYETERTTREVTNLSALNKLKETEIENKNLLLVTGLIVVLLGIVSVVFLLWRYRQKMKNEKVLQLKNNLIEKQNTQLQIQAEEKGALLQEIHHRVKNNLQLIASLINLQTSQVENPLVIRELEKTRIRIMSIALIHQRLYQHENMKSIDLKSFLDNLVDTILSTLSSETQIERDFDIESVNVEAEMAISIGLIVNELVTNSIKHSVSQTISPRLTIRLKHALGKIVLEVLDNGDGIKVPNQTESEGGFGLRLIEILLKRLSGTMQTDFKYGSHTRIEIAHQMAY